MKLSMNRWSDPERAFLLLTCCNQLCVALTFGTYVLFLRSLGLDALEVNLVNVVFYLGRFAFEVPTGAIADTFGHRISCICAFALYAVGCFAYWLAGSLGTAMLAEFILAVGATCLSGAFSAWIKEQLLARSGIANERQRYAVTAPAMHRVQARAASWRQGMSIVAAPAGGILAWLFGLGTPFLVASLGMAFTTVLAIRLMPRDQEPASQVPLRCLLRTGFATVLLTTKRGFSFAHASPDVRAFLVLSSLLSFGFMVPNMQWAPTFAPNLGGVLGASFLFSGIAFLIWCGTRLVPLVLRAGESNALALASCGIGAGILLTGSVAFPLSLGAFALYELSYGVLAPLREAGINNAIRPLEGAHPSATHHERVRATVLSIDEMAAKVAGALGLGVTGALAASADPRLAWIVGGIACLLGAAAAVRMR